MQPTAYSRVTNPERFRALVVHALEVFDHLRRAYDVTESCILEPLPGLLPSFEHARPPITLVPVLPGAASLGLAFTRFPGVIVRYGRWHATSFPFCGCDACDESVADEAARLEDLACCVVAGFSEELRTPLFGDARLFIQFECGDKEYQRSKRWTAVSRTVARALGSGAASVARWQPWPCRQGV